MYTLRTENDGMFLYAVKDGKTEVDFTDEYAVTAFLNEVNELTAENAKLRAELAEAEAALEAIADMTMSMVVNVQHMNDERGRIARAYLSKHTATA